MNLMPAPICVDCGRDGGRDVAACGRCGGELVDVNLQAILCCDGDCCESDDRRASHFFRWRLQ